MRVKLYVEGGGTGPLLDTKFREAWHRFFAAAGFSGRMPKVVRGGGREETIEKFVTAFGAAAPDEHVLLLIDSESRVADSVSPERHIGIDRWAPAPNVADSRVFLMVQTMETWIISDRDALRRFFRGCFNETRLPAWQDLEAVNKHDVFTALTAATAACNRPYAKGIVSFELLGALSPSKVESRCPSAKALLDRLRVLLGVQAI